MKRITFGALGVACFMLAGTWSLQAQTTMLTVKVPFQFIVQGRTLSAGAYTLQRSDGTVPILFLRCTDCEDEAIFFATAESRKTNASSGSALTFDHVGTFYFLRGVIQGPWDDDYQLPEPKRERELIARGTPVEPTQMAASRR